MSSNFNIKNWPIVYFKSNENGVNDESFEEYKKDYLSLLLLCKQKNEKMVLICNINVKESIPMKYIMKQVQFNKEVYKFNKEYIKCVCIMCKDKNFKNILTLYFGMVRPAAPYKLCRSFFKINKYLVERHNITFNTQIFDENNNIVEEEDDNQNDEYELNIDNTKEEEYYDKNKDIEHVINNL
jgi:hypothetical protein